MRGLPLILAFVLGPMLENALRQSLVISRGDFMVFVTRPISAVLLGIAADASSLYGFAVYQETSAGIRGTGGVGVRKEPGAGKILQGLP